MCIRDSSETADGPADPQPGTDTDAPVQAPPDVAPAIDEEQPATAASDTDAEVIDGQTYPESPADPATDAMAAPSAFDGAEEAEVADATGEIVDTGKATEPEMTPHSNDEDDDVDAVIPATRFDREPTDMFERAAEGTGDIFVDDPRYLDRNDQGEVEVEDLYRDDDDDPVSYTHLTLPTSATV